MSSSDRRAVILSALALGACGFAPVYGPGGAGQALWGDVAIDDPVDREGFLLVRQLEDRLGRAQSAAYRLSATIELEDEGAGITPEQVITRFRVLGIADFTLTRIATGEAVLTGRVSNFTGYSATGNTVAVRTAADDAVERLMVVLADQIVARLLVTAPEWRA